MKVKRWDLGLMEENVTIEVSANYMRKIKGLHLIQLIMCRFCFDKSSYTLPFPCYRYGWQHIFQWLAHSSRDCHQCTVVLTLNPLTIFLKSWILIDTVQRLPQIIKLE